MVKVIIDFYKSRDIHKNMEVVTKINQKMRTFVPVVVQKRLDLKPGDGLVWKIEKDGVYVSKLTESGE